MKVVTALAMLGVFVLAGCTSPEEQAARDDETCRGYGAKRGTSIYVECRMRQVELRQNRAALAASEPAYCVRTPYNPGICY